ncbi:biotin--[acetyl-CoA-carboxylase] ligase [Sphingomonas sp. CGMCC 1.13654]|uniref:biotin--[biotin carboxyl-carrier protein] ligase n=1 Tax=Sphingomonas chungangi TaxID=2683589 RepID=A0A838LCB9_9SPHN|nr:biotin--[acetyl-CoA-carboxylase] ligase [Sphingomonas chungangi]MBA2935786.1 biotin--[acetyl-CoA-carboxylase] ligase [Sphingomonas chungangi]MVW54477.1 biotin--[acetyl-CoA-carboxylase] ligase [Sphingomonas chungangi]
MTDIRTIRDTLSTNDEVLALAQAGAPEGVWVRAEQQRGGRGRQGRTWVSPPGNLYASVLVRLQPHDPPAPSLALVAAVAVAEAVEAFGATAQIKWPNDLLVDGAKLSGILLERADGAVVVGIGVNLAHHPEDIDRPATSLAAALGHAPDPDAFITALAESFARWLYRWRAEGLAPIRARWLEKAHPIGTALTARLPDGSSLEGLFDGLDAMGALRLRLADGQVHVIHAADVFLIRD